ncbi:MAG: alpha/beta hydrolase fold protein [Frankiales bacterium]|nr:alpha/beta hydrolase fold protein [Frankiales bacterium]
MVTEASPDDVLLVHGVGSSFEHNWVQLGWVDLLADAGRTALPFDLPGHGSRSGDPSADAADLIIAEAERHGQLDAVGFSAGGFALLRAAVRRPELFSRIAVMGVGDAGLSPRAASGDGGDGAGQLSGILEALRSGVEPTGGPALVISRLAATAGNDPKAVAEFITTEHPNPSLAEVGAITAKTLVVEGSEDFGGPAQALAEAIPGARRIVLKGVDHFALPSDFRALDAVLGFLAE